MTWTVVEGTYRDGQVFLKEKVDDRNLSDVLVLIPNYSKTAKQSHTWERLRQQIATEMPDLLVMKERDQRREFDRLSTQIAQQMSYQSLEEFENAMRGDEYGLARY
jgi:hypothetical protein